MSVPSTTSARCRGHFHPGSLVHRSDRPAELVRQKCRPIQAKPAHVNSWPFSVSLSNASWRGKKFCFSR